MAKLSPPPTYQQIADKDTGKVSLQWLLFFDQLFTGDQGQSWIPTITGLGETGVPAITGTLYQFGNLAFFTIVIIPATNTSSVSGTTYCTNFPLTIKSDSPNFAVTNAPSSASSMCDSSTNRIYFPTWTNITSQITISGWVAAS